MGRVKYGLLRLSIYKTNIAQWLSWGSIECPPVAVFNRDEAMLLMRTLAAIKKIDASSGRALGQVSVGHFCGLLSLIFVEAPHFYLG